MPRAQITILRILHAILWFGVCFGILQRVAPDFAFQDFCLQRPSTLYKYSVVALVATSFGAGVGALVGRVWQGAVFAVAVTISFLVLWARVRESR